MNLQNLYSLQPVLPIILNFNLSKTKNMAKTKPTPKAAAKKAPAPKAAPKVIAIGDTVNYQFNEEECEELSLEAGSTTTAQVTDIKESGEHLITFNYRTGQPRNKGAHLGNKPGNISI